MFPSSEINSSSGNKRFTFVSIVLSRNFVINYAKISFIGVLKGRNFIFTFEKNSAVTDLGSIRTIKNVN